MPASQKKHTLERGVRAYLPPMYYRLFKGYVNYSGDSQSASCTYMVKKFFDAMPQEEKQKILEHSKNSY